MKLTYLTVAALASCLALSVSAQSPSVAAAAPDAPSVGSAPRIAVITFQEAVAATNDFQRRYADLQKKYDPKRQQIKTLSDEVASLQKELQAQSATLTDADRATKAKQLDEKQKELKRTGEDAQGDFQQDMQQTFGTVAEKVAATIDAYAKEHGYSVVLDRDQQVPVVLYANESSDITKAIVDAYNVKSGIPAPEHAAGAPAGTGATTPRTTTPKSTTTTSPH
jgi:outer membrane protein